MPLPSGLYSLMSYPAPEEQFLQHSGYYEMKRRRLYCSSTGRGQLMGTRKIDWKEEWS